MHFFQEMAPTNKDKHRTNKPKGAQLWITIIQQHYTINMKRKANDNEWAKQTIYHLPLNKFKRSPSQSL